MEYQKHVGVSELKKWKWRGLSPSSQDKMTETGLTLLPETTNKTQAKCAEQWFSRHYIRQQRTAIPERKETNEVSQVVSQLTAFRVSRPQCSGRRGGTQTAPSGHPELSKRSLESRRDHSRFQDKSTWEESYTWNSGGLQNGLPQIFSRALNSTMCARKVSKKLGKEPSERIRGNHARRGLRIVSVSTNQNGKLPNSWDIQ